MARFAPRRLPGLPPPPPGTPEPPRRPWEPPEPREDLPPARPWVPPSPPAARPPAAPAAPSLGNIHERAAEYQARVDPSKSVAQYETWMNMGLFDPTTGKFRSENVDESGNPIEGTFENPTDCPPGMIKWGAGNTCVPVGSRPFSGGEAVPGSADFARAGGRGFGGGAWGGGYVSANPEFEKLFGDKIRAYLTGAEAPFSEEEATALRGKAFEAAQGRAETEQQALTEDLIRRGIFRSGIAAREGANIRRGAAAETSQAARDIYLRKAEVNAQAKMASLDKLQRWLEAQQQAVLQHETNAQRREEALAQIELAKMSLAQQREIAGRSNVQFTDPDTGESYEIPEYLLQ